jgi:hypothetical protein
MTFTVMQGVVIAATLSLAFGCAELKDTGKTIGHGTKDVATAIGHASRDTAKAIGRNTKKVVEDLTEEGKDSPVED